MQLSLTELMEGDLVLVECNKDKANVITIPNITQDQIKAIYKIVGYDSKPQEPKDTGIHLRD